MKKKQKQDTVIRDTVEISSKSEAEVNAERGTDENQQQNDGINISIQDGDEIEALREELKASENELEKEREQRLRLYAEYNNYRRRTQEQFRVLTELAGESIIVKLLPVMDDFQRFFEQLKDKTDIESFAQGIHLVQKKLEDVVSSEGVQPIDSVGQEFDAEIHEAIAQVNDPSKPGGSILIEVLKGYRLGGKIIRHPKVVVNMQAESQNTDETENE